MGKTINQLSEADALTAGDKLPVYQSDNCDARKVSMSAVKTFCQQGAIATDDKETQYLTPLTGFSKTVTPTVAGGSVFLILSPAGTIATGTIVLPSSATAADRQEVLVTTLNTVTALTVSAGGTTVVGPPTTITATSPFKMRYDAVTSAWYRVV